MRPIGVIPTGKDEPGMVLQRRDREGGIYVLRSSHTDSSLLTHGNITNRVHVFPCMLAIQTMADIALLVPQDFKFRTDLQLDSTYRVVDCMSYASSLLVLPQCCAA